MDDQLAHRIYGFLSAAGTPPRASETSGPYVVATTTGLVRDENQDAGLVLRARFGGSADRDFSLAVVCDGLGGMRQGREAAMLGISSFAARLVRSTRVPLMDRARAAMLHANDLVFNLLRGSGGTTMSAVITVRSGESVIAHAGDSRVYGWTAGGDIEQLTIDDTLEAVRNKQPDPSGDRDSRILQFVGMGEDLEPHISIHSSNNVRAYLITSDGAHDLPNYLFRRAAGAARHVSDLPRRLIQVSELLGGLDNATAVVAAPRLPTDSSGEGSGIDLALVSAFGRLDIWITPAGEERAEAGAEGAESSRKPLPEPIAKPNTSEEELRTGASKKEFAGGPAQKRRRKPRKKQPTPPDDQLPLPPASLNIRVIEGKD